MPHAKMRISRNSPVRTCQVRLLLVCAVATVCACNGQQATPDGASSTQIAPWVGFESKVEVVIVYEKHDSEWNPTLYESVRYVDEKVIPACDEVVGTSTAAVPMPFPPMCDASLVAVDDLDLSRLRWTVVICVNRFVDRKAGAPKDLDTALKNRLRAMVGGMLRDYLADQESQWRAETGAPVPVLRRVRVRRLRRGSWEAHMTLGVKGREPTPKPVVMKVRGTEVAYSGKEGRPTRVTTVLEAENVQQIGDVVHHVNVKSPIEKTTSWQCRIHMGRRVLRTSTVQVELASPVRRPASPEPATQPAGRRSGNRN